MADRLNTITNANFLFLLRKSGVTRPTLVK